MFQVQSDPGQVLVIVPITWKFYYIRLILVMSGIIHTFSKLDTKH